MNGLELDGFNNVFVDDVSDLRKIFQRQSKNLKQETQIKETFQKAQMKISNLRAKALFWQVHF